MDEMSPPMVGAYIEIEDLVGAVVEQVGQFKDMAAWERFPFKGAGGVGIAPDDDIHSITLLSKAAFEQGKIWWALLRFRD